MEPFFVDNFIERFSEEVGGIVNTRHVVDINNTAVNTVTDEVSSNVNVSHAKMGVRIVCTCDCALIIAVEDRGLVLWETELME
jgi:hypothetical protein